MAKKRKQSVENHLARGVHETGTPLATGETFALAINDGGVLATYPRVHRKGPLRIGNARIMAFVLRDKRRMLSGRAVTTALGLTGRGTGMARFLNSESLQPHISGKLRDALENPVLFVVSPGLPLALGYEAWVLPELCHTLVEAHDSGALHPQLAKTVERAKLLIRGFSTVGIIALIDEATGVLYEQQRTALEELLALYIAPKYLPWAQTFPPEFYKEIFRLRGWNWESINNKRPRLVGKLTRNIIYERLSPELLRRLEEVNPVVKDGRRRYKNSQWLTEDYGQPALKMRREAVEALMRASDDWPAFMTLLDKAFPMPDKRLAKEERKRLAPTAPRRLRKPEPESGPQGSLFDGLAE